MASDISLKILLLYILSNFIYFAPQASKDVSDFYASWDLMEVTTIAQVVALAGESLEGVDAGLTATAFENIVQQIFNKISLFSKWKKGWVPNY